MPAAKPSSLNSRVSKEDAAARNEAEQSMRPISELPARPACLRGHSHAARVWDKLLRLYSETTAEIVTAFDEELLVRLCMTSEQIAELEKLRASAMAVWRSQEKKFKAAKKSEAVYLSQLSANALDGIARLDARLDNKTKLWHTLAQSLYLTPRARAGVAPNKKSAAIPQSEMDEILGSLDV